MFFRDFVEESSGGGAVGWDDGGSRERIMDRMARDSRTAAGMCIACHECVILPEHVERVVATPFTGCWFSTIKSSCVGRGTCVLVGGGLGTHNAVVFNHPSCFMVYFHKCKIFAVALLSCQLFQFQAGSLVCVRCMHMSLTKPGARVRALPTIAAGQTWNDSDSLPTPRQSRRTCMECNREPFFSITRGFNVEHVRKIER